MSHCYPYPLPAVAVDLAIFTLRPDDLGLEVLLVERGGPPYRGHWALPGGFVEVGGGYRPDAGQGEDLHEAAFRELAEETGLCAEDLALHQVGAVGTPGRDPRGRVVSVLYAGLAPEAARTRPRGGDDARRARFVPVGATGLLAFDHDRLLARARWPRALLLDARVLRPWVAAGLRERLAVLYGQMTEVLPEAPPFDRWLARQIEDGHVLPTATGHRLAPGPPIGTDTEAR